MHKRHKKLESQIEELTPLVSSLTKTSSLEEKLNIISKWVNLNDYSQEIQTLFDYLKDKNSEMEFAFKAILAIGQAPIVFNLNSATEDRELRFQKLIQRLVEVENFYQEIGGIVGYHFLVLQLILEEPEAKQQLRYIPPTGLYVGEESAQVRLYVNWGIQKLPHTAAIFPIGGAGDRLSLREENTGKPLPAAVLPFLGRSLLEGLIRDVQAFEYLYYKLYNQKLQIPIALMTSEEKDNHHQIEALLKEHNWFGRKPESFLLFMQPLVPVITEEGDWSLSHCLTLTLKPGGHGIIWKLAQQKGVFQQLTSQGYHQAFVRQINNPLANIDCSLLALIGMGSKNHKSLGFLSCERLLHSSEGINVLIEQQENETYSYSITNIEYTDFDKKKIGEEPLANGSPFSKYPANTNILFINIPAIQQALKKCPLPGKLINMKTVVPYIDSSGNKTELKGGRLESTMQNIADYLQDTFSHPLEKEEYTDCLQTFIIFSDRIKTISTTKKSYKAGESSLGTPEQAYYDYLFNNRELFEKKCHFSLTPFCSLEEYLERGPNCIIIFHPALGPLYSIIAQKIQRGRLAENAELQLDLAELYMKDLDLEGSLLIESPSPLGGTNAEGHLLYHHPARCCLKNVKIHNKGIDRQATQTYWKNHLVRHEALKITLDEGAEFHAENITIEGDHHFEVPAYHCLTLSLNNQGKLTSQLKKMAHPSWRWHYVFDEDNYVNLQKL